MNCPLCDTPFGADENQVCDHEADWYRDWLATATDALQRIADNYSHEGATIAQRALDEIRESTR